MLGLTGEQEFKHAFTQKGLVLELTGEQEFKHAFTQKGLVLELIYIGGEGIQTHFYTKGTGVGINIYQGSRNSNALLHKRDWCWD